VQVTQFHATFGCLIMLLLSLVGVYFQALGTSPLKTQYATMVLFFDLIAELKIILK
jgi:hypothetical protein